MCKCMDPLKRGSLFILAARVYRVSADTGCMSCGASLESEVESVCVCSATVTMALITGCRSNFESR